MFFRIRQAAVIMAAAGLLMMSRSFPVQAAKKVETRTPITSVSIQVQSDVRGGYERDEATVSAKSDSSLYTIGGYEWKNKNKEVWEPGDVPKVQIEVHAAKGYYFYKMTGKSKIHVTGATLSTSKTTNESETLLVTVELTPASGNLERPAYAEWTGYPLGKGSWEAVPYAGAYELKLYRDDQLQHSIPKVLTTNFDFYPYMTVPGTYQFRVRAIPKNMDEIGYITEGEWEYSDRLDVMGEEVWGNGRGGNTNSPSDGKVEPRSGWIKDDEGWWYQKADSSYPANTWYQIDGRWYLFDYDGYMLTGWREKDGKTYYMDINGVMQTGWVQENRKWYYFGGDGAMRTGWLEDGGNWYYLDPNGVMHTEWLQDGGKWYYFNPSGGAMLKNTSVGGRYLDQAGVWQG